MCFVHNEWFWPLFEIKSYVRCKWALHWPVLLMTKCHKGLVNDFVSSFCLGCCEWCVNSFISAQFCTFLSIALWWAGGYGGLLTVCLVCYPTQKDITLLKRWRMKQPRMSIAQIKSGDSSAFWVFLLDSWRVVSMSQLVACFCTTKSPSFYYRRTLAAVTH